MVSLEEGIRTAQVKLALWGHIKPRWPMWEVVKQETVGSNEQAQLPSL